MKGLNLYTLIIALLATIALSSCESEPYPPPGYHDSYIDSDLTGTWELAYVDGYEVYRANTHWLDFYGDGRGYYYYYEHGNEYNLPFDYYSEYVYDESILYLFYADGTCAEMYYWYNYDYSTLYLQWYERGRTTTYTYYRVGAIYWSPSDEKSVYSEKPNNLSFTNPPGLK